MVVKNDFNFLKHLFLKVFFLISETLQQQHTKNDFVVSAFFCMIYVMVTHSPRFPVS